MGCHQRVVATDDLEPHPQLLQLRKGLGDAGFWRIGKHEHADQHHVGLTVARDRAVAIELAHGNAQGAIALGVKGLGPLFDLLPHLIKGQTPPCMLGAAADLQHLVECTLRDQQRLTTSLNQHTEPFALKVVGQLVTLAPTIGVGWLMTPDRRIDRIGKRCLKRSIEPGL